MRQIFLYLAIAFAAYPSIGDARKSKATPVSPIGDQASWFPPNSYPAEAKRKGEQGKVSAVLAINEAGRPTACAIASSSGSASLDAVTCKLAVANGRFNPAKDERGRPITARFWLRGVRWALFDDDADLPAAATTETVRSVEIEVDEQGKGVSCRPLDNGAIEGPGCDQFKPGGQVVQPQIRDGKPVTATVTMISTVRVVPH